MKYSLLFLCIIQNVFFQGVGCTSESSSTLVACLGSTVYLSTDKDASQHKISEGNRWVNVPTHYKDSYSWKKDDSVLNVLNDDRYETVRSGLIIEDVTAIDQGSYILTEGEERRETSFTLRVPNTDLTVIGSKNITANINDRVVLKVKANHSGNSVWYFKEQILSKSPTSHHYKFPHSLHYGLAFGAVLEIRKVQRRHEGRYRLTYDVSGCQNHIDVFVGVVGGKGPTTPLFNYIAISGKNILAKLNTKKGRIFGIVALVIVGIVVLGACLVSLYYLGMWISTKSIQSKRTLNKTAAGIIWYMRQSKETTKKWKDKIQQCRNYFTTTRTYAKVPDNDLSDAEIQNNALEDFAKRSCSEDEINMSLIGNN